MKAKTQRPKGPSTQLSRRETMLIRHAIARYEKTQELTVYAGKLEMMRISLWRLRTMNVIQGRPDSLTLYYATGTEIVFG